ELASSFEGLFARFCDELVSRKSDSLSEAVGGCPTGRRERHSSRMADDESALLKPVEPDIDRHLLVTGRAQREAGSKLEYLGEVEDDLPDFDDRVEAFGYGCRLTTGTPICRHPAE